MSCWIPSHVNSRGNELADKEAKMALNLPEILLDFKSHIHRHINCKYQSICDNQIQNKLHEIKANLYSKDNVILNRKE